MCDATAAMNPAPSGPAPRPTQQSSSKSQIRVQLIVVGGGDDNSHTQPSDANQLLSCLQRIVAVVQLCGVNLAWSASNGLIIISLPQLTAELDLPESLAFWPSSVQGLATASTLLLSGSVADVLGPRPVNLTGCIFNGIFILCVGFVRSGRQLVILRALQGVTVALHLASSVALVSEVQPRGRGRNVSFACLGLSQLLGFTLGLVVGGVLVDTSGWRFGWYLCGGFTLLLSAIGMWSLPNSARLSYRDIVYGLRSKVDWIGTLLASIFMASLSYYLA
jgi:MFS family permease